MYAKTAVRFWIIARADEAQVTEDGHAVTVADMTATAYIYLHCGESMHDKLVRLVC